MAKGPDTTPKCIIFLRYCVHVLLLQITQIIMMAGMLTFLGYQEQHADLCIRVVGKIVVDACINNIAEENLTPIFDTNVW